MVKVDYKKKLEMFFDTEDNLFQVGDMVKVTRLCDIEGNELEEIDCRYDDLFTKGKIDFVMGSDLDGGYVYGVEGAKYCFNRYELELV
jgi:hypothetical protein